MHSDKTNPKQIVSSLPQGNGFLPQFHRTRFRLRNQFLAPRDLPRTLAGVAPLNRSA
jgi:hypothetical protein